MKAGFCHYHKYSLTFHQMRKHGCLTKQGTWCKRFEPNIEHQWWKDRMNKGRSIDLLAPFMKKKVKNDEIRSSENEDRSRAESIC